MRKGTVINSNIINQSLEISTVDFTTDGHALLGFSDDSGGFCANKITINQYRHRSTVIHHRDLMPLFIVTQKIGIIDWNNVFQRITTRTITNVKNKSFTFNTRRGGYPPVFFQRTSPIDNTCLIIGISPRW